MQSMQSAPVISISEARVRGRRVARAIEVQRNLRAAERRAKPRGRGRAWVNGIELGEPMLAFAHLAESYD